MADLGNGSSETPGGTWNSKRLQQTQAQVNDVIGVMKDNVNKVMEREQHLASLDHRADVLQEGASRFQQSSTSLRKKYWWKNLKMMICLGVLIFFIVLAFVLWVTNRAIFREERRWKNNTTNIRNERI
ncbi:unnamed protein product [Caenorhabditis auriculariae]|uniref:V-SNARE coiled-coil homology domain-containing protein n=1 Tax=Caenorhabditis auriculariae TaxID=2777116 RepID=A0A8S1GTC9_9PELO|nr:unnamed protein product [Caenorhabditis auriculariae]